MSEDMAKVRLLFVDQGSYHHEEVTVPAAALEPYDRVFDALREDPVILKRLHVDVRRLCAAYRVPGDDDRA